ncbi:pilin [Streptosporangium minutum]|uniref:pilin n=1 Tax=Streptosporangium minutum TaxID=569862 RepID=UPI000A3A050B|nr:pilin [Streptosporangium minutum]
MRRGRQLRHGGDSDQLGTVFTNIRTSLVGLLVTLAMLMLTIGGLRYLVAGGDPGEVQKAKVALKAAALGYGLAMLAPLFVNVLKRIVGGE